MIAFFVYQIKKESNRKLESYIVSPLLVNGAACINNIFFDRSVMNYYSAEEAAALDARLGTAEAGTCELVWGV